MTTLRDALRAAGHPEEEVVESPPSALTITKLSEKLGDVVPIQHLVSGLVYDGGFLHWWYGPPKRGKSMMARYVAAKTYEATGRPTLWIDHEVGWYQTAQAVMDLGMAERVDDVFAYVDVLGEDTHLPREVAGLRGAIEATVLETNAAAVCVDSAGKQLSTLGFSEDANDEVTRWTSEVLLPVARRCGIPVHVIDHVTKTGRGSDGWARGAGEKIGACDLAWQVTSAGFSQHEAGVIELANHEIDRYGRMPSKMYYAAGGQGENNPLTLAETDEPEAGETAGLQRLGTETRQAQAAERRDMLHALLVEHGELSTAQLAQISDVNPETIRRDLGNDLQVEQPRRGFWKMADNQPPSIA